MPIKGVHFPASEQFDSWSSASCSRLCRFGSLQFFSTKILAVHEEWFSRAWFRHISWECRIWLKQIYDKFSEQSAFSSVIDVILTRVSLLLKERAGKRAQVQGCASLATGRNAVGQGQGSSSCIQGRTASCETGSSGVRMERAVDQGQARCKGANYCN